MFSLFQVKYRRISLELISWGPHSGLKRERKIRRRLFTSFIKRNITHFHVVVVQWRQRNEQKEWCTCTVFFCYKNSLLFWLSPHLTSATCRIGIHTAPKYGTKPIRYAGDAPLSISAGRSFVPSQKSHRHNRSCVWTEALVRHDFRGSVQAIRLSVDITLSPAEDVCFISAKLNSHENKQQ